MNRILSLAAGALALTLLAGCAAQNPGREAVPVESVGLITGTGVTFLADSYPGKVVSGRTAEVKRDSDKTVLEVRVAEGDMVAEGDILFTYDTEAMQLSLDKLILEREGLDNSITSAEEEIEQLERDKANAGADQQLEYTLQINARQADIREAEYNRTLKDKEIQTMEDAMEKTEVPSPLAGRVMSVGSQDGDPGAESLGTGDSSDAFVTVTDVSSLRVEGRINELNRGSLTEGMPVIIRSRIDPDRTWHGVIDMIDWEKPVSADNNAMMGMNSGDEMTTSSRYPFYVTLDSNEDLLLGQHVYIEPDLGGDGSDELRLPAWYIVDDGYVWAADARDKLEKRPVELGSYDEEMEEYEILSGLDPADYIAFPEEDLAEGMSVVRYDESSFGEDGSFAGDEFPMDEEFPEDEEFPMDEELPEDELLPDGAED